MRRRWSCSSIWALTACAHGAIESSRPSPAIARELAVFNATFRLAILHDKDAEILALWADDGINLLPNTAPLVGKPAIAAALARFRAAYPEAHAVQQDLTCTDMVVAGNLASEWCLTHQLVVMTSSTADTPTEVSGRMLLVLRQDPDGWHLIREMWNTGS